MELIVKVPKELEEEMKSLSKLELSLAVIKIIEERFERFARLKRIVNKSKLKESDVVELSIKIDNSLSERLIDSLKG